MLSAEAKLFILTGTGAIKNIIMRGISVNTTGSISTSVMWKLSPGKLPFPRTWNNIEMDIF